MNRQIRRAYTCMLLFLMIGFIVVGCTPQQDASSEKAMEKDAGDAMMEKGDGGVMEKDAGDAMMEKGDATLPTALVTVTLNEWSAKLDKSIVKAGKIKFVVTNIGKFPHAIRIDDQQQSVNTDEIEVIEATLEPGTYDIICPLPGHAEKGMKTTLTVQ